MNPLQATDPLAQLRDIHLPEAIGYWPLAPGWWLLAILLLLATGFAVYFIRHQLQARRYRKVALQQLAKLQSAMTEPTTYLAGVNRLLKQTLLAAPQSTVPAGLTGEAWLAYLDATGQTNHFSTGPGQYLLDGPYQEKLTDFKTADLKPLHQLIEQWIKKHRLTTTTIQGESLYAEL